MCMWQPVRFPHPHASPFPLAALPGGWQLDLSPPGWLPVCLCGMQLKTKDVEIFITKVCMSRKYPDLPPSWVSPPMHVELPVSTPTTLRYERTSRDHQMFGYKRGKAESETKNTTQPKTNKKTSKRPEEGVMEKRQTMQEKLIIIIIIIIIIILP